MADAAARLSRLPIFSARDYLAANPDVARAGIDAAAHALTDGAREGRPLFTETALARAYGRAAGRALPAPPIEGGPRPGGAASGRRCTLFLHSASGEAYRELARGLAADLARLGLDAAFGDERADPGADHGIAFFVAPHVFFESALGAVWAEDGMPGRAFVVVDDPVDAVEGARALGPVLGAGGVADASAVGAGLWSEAGIPTLHHRPEVRMRSRWLAPGDLAHPLMLAAPERARSPDGDPLGWDGRALDLLFFARESAPRRAALGRLAAPLAAHRCFVYAERPVATVAEAELRRDAHWRIAGHLSAQARLTLHVAEGRFPALERRRLVVQAMAGGSALVSTARFVEPGLDAGTHYFHDDVKHVGALVDWLVCDPDGRRAARRVRERAFDRIATWNADPRRLDGLRAALVGAPRQLVEEDLR